jgi:hypothetical protein
MKDWEIPDDITVEVTLAEVLSGRTGRAALPNGRVVFAYMKSGLAGEIPEKESRWLARMRVADFERAELLERR